MHKLMHTWDKCAKTAERRSRLRLAHCVRFTTMSNPSDEITTREAMDILDVASPSQVTRWVHEHKLTPSRQLPGRTGAFLFHRAEIERFAAELAARPARRREEKRRRLLEQLARIDAEAAS